MEKIKNIIAYIMSKYPNKDELSNARLTKLVYLADWRQAITKQQQISNISWYFDNYGPFVPDIQETINHYPSLFKTINTLNMYGHPKTVFEMIPSDFKITLSDEEIETIEYVINTTKDLNWDEFIKLVYSTYPISSSERYSFLNLVEKAEEYTSHK